MVSSLWGNRAFSGVPHVIIFYNPVLISAYFEKIHLVARNKEVGFCINFLFDRLMLFGTKWLLNFGSFSAVHGSEVTGIAGEIASPVYPHSYTGQSNYRWTINVPERHFVRVEFTEMSIEKVPRLTGTAPCRSAIFVSFFRDISRSRFPLRS